MSICTSLRNMSILTFGRRTSKYVLPASNHLVDISIICLSLVSQPKGNSECRFWVTIRVTSRKKALQGSFGHFCGIHASADNTDAIGGHRSLQCLGILFAADGGGLP